MKVKQHHFSIELAKVIGVDRAIIMANLEYWLDWSKANKKNMHDGYYWTYNSAAAFSELFPYWTANKIQKVLKKMESENLIIQGTFNKAGYDRTKWYTTSDYSIQPNGLMDSAKRLDPLSQTAEPIPYINTNNKPNSKQDIKSEQNSDDHKAKSKFKFSIEDLDFAKSMFKLIKKVAPHVKQPNFESWANDIRCMRELDNLNRDHMVRIFKWANANSFWASNILSAKKFRDKFPSLDAQARALIEPPQTGQASRKELNIKKALQDIQSSNNQTVERDITPGNALPFKNDKK